MAKILGIDYGLERTGLAISDPDEKIAFPLATLSLHDFGRRSELLDAICARALTEQVDKIVLGLPLHEDGAENMACRQARNIAARLKRRLAMPVYLMPETLSTVEAEQDLREAGIKKRKLKKVLDQQAACRILSSFLNLAESARIMA